MAPFLVGNKGSARMGGLLRRFPKWEDLRSEDLCVSTLEVACYGRNWTKMALNGHGSPYWLTMQELYCWWMFWLQQVPLQERQKYSFQVVGTKLHALVQMCLVPGDCQQGDFKLLQTWDQNFMIVMNMVAGSFVWDFSM